MFLLGRRKFIGLILASAAGSIVYKEFYDFKYTATSADDVYEERLASYIAAFGLQLKGVKFDGYKVDRIEQLEQKLYSRDWNNVDSEEAFNSRLSEIISEDFSAGRTVRIDGWILSEFERDMIAYALYIKDKHGVADKDDVVTFENAKYKEFIKIKDWGPKATCTGMGFNQQSDGHSSHWFSIDPYNGRLRVFLNDIALITTKGTEILTTKVDGEALERILATTGALNVMVYDPARGVKQKIGDFEVFARSEPALLANGTESKAFGLVEKWGPKNRLLPQPSDVEKNPFWIKTQCAPRDAVIMFGDIPLKTTVGTSLVTGVFSESDLPLYAGEYDIQLRSRESNEAIVVGKSVLEE